MRLEMNKTNIVDFFSLVAIKIINGTLFLIQMKFASDEIYRDGK